MRRPRQAGRTSGINSIGGRRCTRCSGPLGTCPTTASLEQGGEDLSVSLARFKPQEETRSLRSAAASTRDDRKPVLLGRGSLAKPKISIHSSAGGLLQTIVVRVGQDVWERRADRERCRSGTRLPASSRSAGPSTNPSSCSPRTAPTASMPSPPVPPPLPTPNTPSEPKRRKPAFSTRGSTRREWSFSWGVWPLSRSRGGRRLQRTAARAAR